MHQDARPSLRPQPIPGIGDLNIQGRSAWRPAERSRPFGITDKRGRVARPTRRRLDTDRMSNNPFSRGDDLC